MIHGWRRFKKCVPGLRALWVNMYHDLNNYAGVFGNGNRINIIRNPIRKFVKVPNATVPYRYLSIEPIVNPEFVWPDTTFKVLANLLIQFEAWWIKWKYFGWKYFIFECLICLNIFPLTAKKSGLAVISCLLQNPMKTILKSWCCLFQCDPKYLTHTIYLWEYW